MDKTCEQRGSFNKYKNYKQTNIYDFKGQLRCRSHDEERRYGEVNTHMTH